MTDIAFSSTSRSIGEHEFDRLICGCRQRLFNYFRRRGETYDDAEDVVHATVVEALKAQRCGKYRHYNEAAFTGWLRTIAWHQICRRNQLRQTEQPTPLDFEEEAEHDSSVWQANKPELRPERLAEQSELRALLIQQLDEILIHSHSAQKKKNLGLLRKRAFMRFYLDGLSLHEILEATIEDAARLNIAAQITRSTINNWISRGDILKRLVAHLVEAFPGLVDKLGRIWTLSPGQNAREREILQDEWKLRRPADQVALCECQAPRDATTPLPSAEIKVADLLFAAVKRELHQTRLGKSHCI